MSGEANDGQKNERNGSEVNACVLAKLSNAGHTPFCRYLRNYEQHICMSANALFHGKSKWSEHVLPSQQYKLCVIPFPFKRSPYSHMAAAVLLRARTMGNHNQAYACIML